jgi:hypothetical protein
VIEADAAADAFAEALLEIVHAPIITAGKSNVSPTSGRRESVARGLRVSPRMAPDAEGTFSEAFHTRLRHDCAHPGAREIRMYTSYADANGVRLRLQSLDQGWRHVSGLYEIAGGWAWTLCWECRAEDVGRFRRAVGQ